MTAQRPSRGEEALECVFVYGTLRPGRSNWRVAAPLCIRVEPATLPGFALYSLDHPVAIEVAPDDPPSEQDGAGVRGEVLWLDPDRIAGSIERLDVFEGYDVGAPDRSYYRRVVRSVVIDEGTELEAWVYVPGPRLLAQVADDRRVPGDDWPP
jgi:gamma-glutamylcyclotransferase (GGCT)/AIG2-like uncharacterized protein YtfP